MAAVQKSAKHGKKELPLSILLVSNKSSAKILPSYCASLAFSFIANDTHAAAIVFVNYYGVE